MRDYWMVSVSGLPDQYSSCSWHHDEDALKKMLNINGTKVADGYGCTLLGNTKFLYEKKSNGHIQKGIVQLEETAGKLLDMQQAIDECFILCKRIGRAEKSMYRRKKIKGANGNLLWDKNLDKAIEISHNGKVIPVKLYYIGERC